MNRQRAMQCFAIALVAASLIAYAYVFTHFYPTIPLTLLTPTITPIPPIAGLTIGLLLTIAKPHWWKVLLGAAIVCVAAHLARGTSTLATLTDTGAVLLEALVITHMVARQSDHIESSSTRNFWKIALPLLMLTGFTASLRYTGLSIDAQPLSPLTLWFSVWLGSIVGLAVFAWWIHALARHPTARASRQLTGFWIVWAVLQSAAFVSPESSVLMRQAAFGASVLILPLVIWGRLSFSARTSTSAIALSTVVMVGSHLAGFGPFTGSDNPAGTLALQFFLAALILCELVARRSHDLKLQHLAVSNQNLQTANDRYRALIRQYPDAIYRLSLDTPIRVSQSIEAQIDHFRENAYVAECNDAFARQLGFSRASQVHGQPVSIVIQDNEAFLQSLRDTITSGYKMHGYETTREGSNGESRAYLNSWFGMFEKDAMSDAWCVQMDITEQHKLRDADHMLRQALENAGSGGYEVKSKTGYTAYSERAIKSFGFTPDQVRPHSDFMFERIHPDDLERHWDVIRANLRGDTEYYDDDIRFLHGDNTYHWVNIRGSVVKRDSEGQALSVVAITTDVTEAHENRELLENYRNRLQELIAELALTEEKSRKALATALQEGPLKDLAVAQSKLAELDLPASPELPIIRRLLNSAVVQARSVMFDISPTVLYERGLADAVQWLCTTHQERKGLRCELRQAGDPSEVDDELSITLFQIVRELLKNITKHAQASNAWVHLEWVKDDLLLRVSDNGVGFSFKKGEEGFGLFNIRNRVELLGGTLRLSDSIEADTGTTVEVCVPLSKQSSPASINQR